MLVPGKYCKLKIQKNTKNTERSGEKKDLLKQCDYKTS